MAYFVILLCFALPHGLHTPLSFWDQSPECATLRDVVFPCRQSSPLTPLSTNAEIIRAFRLNDTVLNDPGAIAYVAQETALTHRLGETPWPPGMLSIEAAFYVLSPQFPVGLGLIILTAAVWSAALFVMFDICRRRFQTDAVAFALPLLFLLTAEMSIFFGNYIFNAEPLSAGTLVLGSGLLLSASDRRSMGLSIAAGASLAASAYIREQSDLVMFVALILFATSASVWMLWNRKSAHWIKSFGLALLAYHALTMPYRAANDFQWGQTSTNSLWNFVWKTNSELRPEVQYFANGGTGGCTVDPKRCNIVRQSAVPLTERDLFAITMKSYAVHPIKWLIYKVPFIWNTWFDGSRESVLLALAAVAEFVAFLFAAIGGEPLALLIFVSVAGGIIGPMLMTHIEWRFFELFKMTVVYLLPMALPSVLWSAASVRRFAQLARPQT